MTPSVCRLGVSLRPIMSKLNDGTCGGERPQWMLYVVIRPEQPALFSGEHDKQDRALRPRCIGRKGAGQLYDTDRAGTVVVRAVPDTGAIRAIVIEVGAQNNSLGTQARITTFEQPDDIQLRLRCAAEFSRCSVTVVAGTSREAGLSVRSISLCNSPGVPSSLAATASEIFMYGMCTCRR